MLVKYNNNGISCYTQEIICCLIATKTKVAKNMEINKFSEGKSQPPPPTKWLLPNSFMAYQTIIPL